MNQTASWELRLPYFDDEPWDAKGFFRAQLAYRDRIYALMFYDPVRLAQDVKTELEIASFFFEENLIVVREIKREVLESVARTLVETGQVDRLWPSRE